MFCLQSSGKVEGQYKYIVSDLNTTCIERATVSLFVEHCLTMPSISWNVGWCAYRLTTFISPLFGNFNQSLNLFKVTNFYYQGCVVLGTHFGIGILEPSSNFIAFLVPFESDVGKCAVKECAACVCALVRARC